MDRLIDECVSEVLDLAARLLASRSRGVLPLFASDSEEDLLWADLIERAVGVLSAITGLGMAAADTPSRSMSSRPSSPA